MRHGLVRREQGNSTVSTGRWGQGKPRAKAAKAKRALPNTIHCALAHFASSNHLVLVAIIAVFLFGMMAMAWGQTGSSNPQVPQGGSNSFPATSTTTTSEAGSVGAWDITSSAGVLIADSSQPNGWSVSYSNPQFTVGAPVPAVIAANYKVRVVTGTSTSTTPIGDPNFNANRSATQIKRDSRRALARSHIPAKSVTPAGKDKQFLQSVANPPAQINGASGGGIGGGGSGGGTTYVRKIANFDVVSGSNSGNGGSSGGVSGLIPSNVGKDFWLAFPGGGEGDQGGTTLYELRLDIVGNPGTTGTVSVPGLGSVHPFTIDPTGIAILQTQDELPREARLEGDDAITNQGVHIEADQPVSVSGLNKPKYQGEAYLGLPVSALGVDYFVLASPIVAPGTTFTGISRSQLSLVATKDNTTVTITPRVAAGIAGSEHPAGVPHTLTMHEGQTYQLRAATVGEDLTGSRVVANKPIAVWGGAFVPNPGSGYGYPNPLREQLPSTDKWGKQFVSVPSGSYSKTDTYCILASANNTVVRINGVARASTLAQGGSFQENITGPATISANKPILVAQYSNGGEINGTATNDPVMSLIPATQQFRPDYTIPVPLDESTNPSFYVNLIVAADLASAGDVLLDGVAVPASDFTTVPGSIYVVAKLTLDQGIAHIFRSISQTPFGATTYGKCQGGGAASFGYPAGLQFPIQGGLRGEYFDNPDFTAPVMTRVDPVIDFNWYRYPPHFGMDETNFSVRWTGQVIPETTETYTFVSTVDDGIRLWVDGQLLIDHWQDHAPIEYVGNISLIAGQAYDIKLEYKNTLGGGMPRLEWATPTLPRQIVPQRCLLPYPLPNATVPDAPSNLTATATTAVGGHINLSWTDTSDDEDGFRIERKVGEFGNWQELPSVNANTTTFADSGLAPATTYYYRVRAFNIHANSDYSNEATAAILLGGFEGWPLTIVITQPANGTVYLTPATIAVESVEVAGSTVGGSTPHLVSVRYDLLDLNNGAAVVQSVTVPVPSPAPSTAYSSGVLSNVPMGHYSLLATVTDSAGNTATDTLRDVDVTSGAGGIGAPPAAPTGLSAAAVSNTKVRLLWTDASNNEQGFRIERKTGQNGTWAEVGQVGSNATGFLDGGLLGNTTYVYRVWSFNTYGNSGYSNEASATTHDIVFNHAPSVQITQPSYGATFTVGSTIPIVASASDSDGTVVSVVFKDGGTVIGQGVSSGQGNWTLNWNGAAASAHTLTAVATDNEGASTTSSPILITVQSGNGGGGGFTVTITSPADGDTFTVPATIPISATAVDDFGTVMWVDFYADDGINGPILIGTATSGNPFTFSWENVPQGTYTLTAEATDDTEATAVSDPIVVTVSGSTAPVSSYLSQLKLNPPGIRDNGTTVGTVTISEARNVDTEVLLTSSKPGLVTLPSSVTIPSGSTSASFSINAINGASGDGVATVISGQAGSWDQAELLTIYPASTVIDVVQVAVHPAASAVVLTWNPFPSAAAYGYRVFRRQSGSGNGFVELTSASQPLKAEMFVDNSAPNGVTFDYKVVVQSWDGTLTNGSIANGAASAGTGALSLSNVTTAASGDFLLPINFGNAPIAQSVWAVLDNRQVFVGDSENGSDTGLGVSAVRIDTSILANGNHSVQSVALYDDGSAAVSPIRTMPIQNRWRGDVDYEFDIGTQDRGLVNMEFPSATTKWHAEIVYTDDSSQQIVRSWHGVGANARFAWDGLDQNDSIVTPGEYSIKFWTEGGGLYPYQNPPKKQIRGMLGTIKAFVVLGDHLAPAANQELYDMIKKGFERAGFKLGADLIIWRASQFKDNKKYRDLCIQRLQTSVNFVAYGHGWYEYGYNGQKKPFFNFGPWRFVSWPRFQAPQTSPVNPLNPANPPYWIAVDEKGITKTHVCIANIVPHHYSFVMINSCNSAGGNAPSFGRVYGVPVPNINSGYPEGSGDESFAMAFQVPSDQNPYYAGTFIGWNGGMGSPDYSAWGVPNQWLYWTRRFWEQMRGGLPINTWWQNSSPTTVAAIWNVQDGYGAQGSLSTGDRAHFYGDKYTSTVQP